MSRCPVHQIDYPDGEGCPRCVFGGKQDANPRPAVRLAGGVNPLPPRQRNPLPPRQSNLLQRPERRALVHLPLISHGAATPTQYYVCPACGIAERRILLGPKPHCHDCGTPLRSVARGTQRWSPETASIGDRERTLALTRRSRPTRPNARIPGRAVFYCQNPAQSGDTTGVAVALVLQPHTRLLFLISMEDVDRAADFLRFYSEMGITPDRIAVALGDLSAEARTEVQEALTKLEGDQSELDTRFIQAEQARAKNPAPKDTATELKRLAKGMAKRKEVAEGLLERRFQLKARAVQRRQARARAVEQAAQRLGAFAGLIIEWDHLLERGGNQLYQDLVNIGVRTEANTGLRSLYETAFNVTGADYNDVGQTTRDTAALLVQRKLKRTSLAIRASVASRRYDGVERFIREFSRDLLASQPQIRMRDRKPTIVLIWVRGLNAKELANVRGAGIDPARVGDALHVQLDKFKRNPHHVMTAQLYETIRYAVRMINNKRAHSAVNEGRWLIPVPIGDELRLDWYDYNRPANKNLYEGASRTNLIEFFRRAEEFRGSRHAQMYFLHRLSQEFDVIQVGIRSGAMEQGMYMNVPTIYLEEIGSPSGARMASLATDLTTSYRVQPMDWANATRYPFFYRLQTRHLLGLNQARTQANVEGLIRDLESNRRMDARVERGTLTWAEIATLINGITGICRHFDAYKLALRE